MPIAPSKTMTGREGWWSRSRNRLFIGGKKNVGAYIYNFIYCAILSTFTADSTFMKYSLSQLGEVQGNGANRASAK
ncbi:hypothetical protein CP500_022870 [Tychonema bourrellyi FEM_GT703]|uniref:Uncharacterized protein n=1 Tax=Tychonema bourrellyi FEM_GT703 TaxID=2040638 RepID=A0A2G4EUH3_9CYAN|nr:hypothetical protein CP500_022870 [Tychonema bourrellyi FEM_GT703]